MNAWRNIWTITKRELGAYFTSPLAYVFIVIFLLLCGFFTFFVGGFFERQRGLAGAAFLRLASVVLPVPGAGGGHAAVGRGAARGHHRAAADHAHHRLAGHRREVPGLLAVPGAGAGADVPGGDHGQLPGPPGQRGDPDGLRRELADGRRLPGHQLHHLGADAQPGRQLHHFPGGVPVPDPGRLPAGHQRARTVRRPGWWTWSRPSA